MNVEEGEQRKVAKSGADEGVDGGRRVKDEGWCWWVVECGFRDVDATEHQCVPLAPAVLLQGRRWAISRWGESEN